jgi:hypothetical protein
MANPRYNMQVTNSRTCAKGGGMMREKYASGTQKKNFSKLPEAVQKKINKKLAKEV